MIVDRLTVDLLSVKSSYDLFIDFSCFEKLRFTIGKNSVGILLQYGFINNRIILREECINFYPRRIGIQCIRMYVRRRTVGKWSMLKVHNIYSVQGSRIVSLPARRAVGIIAVRSHHDAAAAAGSVDIEL